MAISPTSRSSQTTNAYLPDRSGNLRRTASARARPLDFHTPYGCSKGAADQYVLDYARSFGLPTAVLRMSCIYGPRQMGTEDQGWVAHFLHPRAARTSRSRLRRRLPGARHPVRRRRGRRLSRPPGAASTTVSGRAFNLGGGPANAVSLRQLLACIEAMIGRRRRDRVFATGGPATSAITSPTPRRCGARNSGCAPPLPWRDGVGDGSLEWLRRRGRVDAAPNRASPREAVGMKVALVNPALDVSTTASISAAASRICRSSSATAARCWSAPATRR